MECQACVLDGIPQALALLTKTYTVSVAPRANSQRRLPVPDDDREARDSRRPKTTDTRELNPFEYKLAREISKRKPKRKVIAAVRSASRNFKSVISKARELAELFARLSKVAALANDDDAAALANSIAEDYRSIVSAVRSAEPKLAALRDNRSNSDSRLLSSLASLAATANDLRAAAAALLPDLREVCLNCSRASNDDNLSHHGQVFVSIDAMNSLGLIASGADPSADLDDRTDPVTAYNGDTPSDDMEDSDSVFAAADSARHDDIRDSSDNIRVSQTAHDYLLSHAVPDVHSDSQASSLLPAHVEDRLRKYLADFNDLDTFEKFLCLSQWSGQSFSEFGTMKWIPQELKHPQSKQFVTQRWNRLVEKFPVASALRKGRVCSSATSDLARHYNDEALEQLDLGLAFSC